ncbi:DUF817 domain-containing protein [Xenorhabdus innexi]|uniref:Membrane protein n=1 Tax=Xenorhabdus innexi TaxID=290109 RepID=A0A1N6MZF1_9GAMM|nr:DUF817 domain-containing protein [Xenorhabdus innexi]PHM30483.1 membrane protein [Xenorhabdus innexi]SIP74226.1 conserved membrane hypothetical protein [Xenorhabdus innexi]
MKSVYHKLNILRKIDDFLMAHKPNNSTGIKRFILEFLFFGVINARSCLFAGLFFVSLFLVPVKGIMGIPRYDVLLVFAVIFQALLIGLKLETWDEFKAICVFHLVGFIMELFKTSASISSWQYPDAAFTKLWGVPLFTGFMYAAVGSFIIQSWRFFKVRVEHYPPYWMATLVALAIYINFFSHHYIDDYRWYLTAFIFGLYARGTIFYTPLDKERRMPLLLAFILIGFFIWLAENFGTFFGIWQYPHQLGAWSVVHAGKWGAWSLLVVVTFTIVVHLKHIKASVAISR